VVFDQNCQPLVRSVIGGALRDGPRAEHALHLKPKIEVKPPGGMLVDHKQPPRLGCTAARVRPRGLGGALERALGPVRGKGIGLGAGHAANLA
jgi:hypothetical protein